MSLAAVNRRMHGASSYACRLVENVEDEYHDELESPWGLCKGEEDVRIAHHHQNRVPMPVSVGVVRRFPDCN